MLPLKKHFACYHWRSTLRLVASSFLPVLNHHLVTFDSLVASTACIPGIAVFYWPPIDQEHPWWLRCEESACNAGATGDSGSIPGSWRLLERGYSNPLQYSCLENSMDRGAWQVIVTKSGTQLKWLSKHASSHRPYSNTLVIPNSLGIVSVARTHLVLHKSLPVFF